MAEAHPLPFNTPRDWAIDLAVAAGGGVFLGLVGPFGSYYNDDALPRVAYWVGTFTLSALTYGLAIRWTMPRAEAAGVPLWAWLPAMAVVVCAPVAVATRLIAVAVWPFISRVGWLEWYGQSLLITVFFTGGYVLLRQYLQPRRAAPARPEPADGEAPILRRLPGRLGQNLLCLQMEDHYVRLHTDQGSELVLMPLSQAMAELNGLQGLKVHRSWWVARRAVTGVIEDGRNLRLRLSNGLEAPVSRASVAKLRAAGWIGG